MTKIPITRKSAQSLISAICAGLGPAPSDKISTLPHNSVTAGKSSVQESKIRRPSWHGQFSLVGSSRERFESTKEHTEEKHVLYTRRPRCHRTLHPLDRWFCVSVFRRICPFQFAKYDHKSVNDASASFSELVN